MSNRALAKANPLPVTYAAAKTAIAKCAKIDEVKDWADKALALRVYAKQSKDKTLEHNAIRIRARAVQRCGQLIEEKPKASGKRKSGGTSTFSRREEAEAAGLSKDQQNQAVRIARVPDDLFEQQVESEKPPTIEALAKQGVQPHPKATGLDPADMDVGRKLWGLILNAYRDSMKIDLARALRGMTPDEIQHTINRGEALANWLAETLVMMRGVRRDDKEEGNSTAESEATTSH